MDNLNTYVIAEAGVNHNGSIEMAHQLIEEAANIGANAIKFQSFQTSEVVIPKSPKANYQNKSAPGSKTQYELLQDLELPKDCYAELKKDCQRHDIDFISTPFDLDSLDCLLDIGMEVIKISSGDITFAPLLLKSAQSGKKVFLSTGMADEKEIGEALAVLAYGYFNPNSQPNSLSEILEAPTSAQEKAVIQRNVTVFHCTSEYPAPFDEINLRAMQTIHKFFGVTVGYSDHSPGILVPCLAVAMGARVIEKHFTLDCTLPGPDHKASLDVAQFSEMIKQIHLTETIMGSARKEPTPVELQNKPIVRRGLYLRNPVKKGEIISSTDLKALRPMTKKTPMHYWDCINKTADCDYEALDEL